MARAVRNTSLIAKLPLFQLIVGLAALSMFVPAGHAMVLGDEGIARAFFYSGVVGLFVVTLIAFADNTNEKPHRALGQLLSLLATFVLLPFFLALPVYDALRNTSYFNAYFEMVSALTTTGFETFNPGRLTPTLHLWRAQVGWMGGLLMWIAASAVLAPLSLGGFEVTARGEPGRGDAGPGLRLRVDPRQRLIRITRTLVPVYVGLTGALWILLLLAGEPPLTAITHAMSVMSTSGISPIGGTENAASGWAGEAVIFLFMFFALSRLTFSADTVTKGYARLDKDPEFRNGLMLVIVVPLILFLRHFLGAYEFTAQGDIIAGLNALWGSMFTVLSFLSTTGFVSDSWQDAQAWSGLESSGLILMGLALMGGGVATTAGGVKLLRVFALYLNGLREMEKLVHPSSVSRARPASRRIQANGAFIAWVIFMLFALSLAVVSILLAAQGLSFEQAILLSVSSLSTTGPLVEVAGDETLRLSELDVAAKLVLVVAMVLGRLETLAIIALLTPNLWRS